MFSLDRRDLSQFEVFRQGNTFVVVGDKIDEIIRGVNLDDPESFAYFQHRLEDEGVIAKLKTEGLKEGDFLRVGNFEFEYSD